MGSRWYTTTVILFWLATMTWLITAKVAPTLRVGERPNLAKAAVESQAAARVPVSWNLFWEDRPLGWATSETRRRKDETTELRSQVHVSRFRLSDLAPAWFWSRLDLGDGNGEMNLDTESVIELVDPGKLKGFRTSVRLGSLAEPILLTGAVKAGMLEINFRLGDFSYTTATSQMADAILGDALSPRSRLPDLHQGQTWTEPMYSPFQPPNQPVQILQATVEREETIEWNGEVVNTWLVVYRNDSGSEAASKAARGRMWIRRDGTVLKQEAMLLGSRLLFVRVPPGQSLPGQSQPDRD